MGGRLWVVVRFIYLDVFGVLQGSVRERKANPEKGGSKMYQVMKIWDDGKMIIDMFKDSEKNDAFDKFDGFLSMIEESNCIEIEVKFIYLIRVANGRSFVVDGRKLF